MNKTKIEWCDMTWNPVTGCPYCYARKIAERFSGGNDSNAVYERAHCHDCTQPGDERLREKRYANSGKPFKYGFAPTFHPYRLGEPQRIKEPQNIFVYSMADLFGDWVPNEWIKAVFEACEKAPQHRYLFLTKNSVRYRKFQDRQADNMWFGTTLTGSHDDKDVLGYAGNNTFLSIEPLLSEFKAVNMWKNIRWVIIGCMTGSMKNKYKPKKEWILNIIESCKSNNTPVFLKNSVIDIIGEKNMIREFPW